MQLIRVTYTTANWFTIEVGPSKKGDGLDIEVRNCGGNIDLLTDEARQGLGQCVAAFLEGLKRPQAEKPAPPPAAALSDADQKLLDNLDTPVKELGLSVRVANCLQKARIRYIGELVQRTETDLFKIKNFGRKTIKEIREILAELVLHLGMTPDKLNGWTPEGAAERNAARAAASAHESPPL